MTYIALLRAINVGGHNVSMEKLRGLFSELGLKNVRSYIQTGNVFFDSSDDRKVLTEKIEKQLHTSLGYEVPTMLRTFEEFENALKAAPFSKMEPTEETRHLVLFNSGALPKDLKLPHRTEKGDYEILAATPGEAFVIMTLQNGRPGNPIHLEKMTGLKSTSRFFHTALKILTAARD